MDLVRLRKVFLVSPIGQARACRLTVHHASLSPTSHDNSSLPALNVLPNPCPLDNTDLLIGYPSGRSLLFTDVSHIVIDSMATYFESAATHRRWPLQYPVRSLHPYPAVGPGYMVVPGPTSPRNHLWTTKVILQGFVGILTYMLLEGFPSGDVEIWRVQEHSRIHLGYIWLGLRSDWDRV